MFKYVQFLMSPYYHLTGIILGFLLVITGIGMWFRKKYSYYLTIVLYSALIINGLVGIVLMIMAKEIGPSILIIFILTLFFIIIRYTQKNRRQGEFINEGFICFNCITRFGICL